MLDKLKDYYKAHKTFVHIGLGIVALIVGFKMFKK